MLSVCDTALHPIPTFDVSENTCETPASSAPVGNMNVVSVPPNTTGRSGKLITGTPGNETDDAGYTYGGIVTLPLGVMNPVKISKDVFVPWLLQPSSREPILIVTPVIGPLTSTGTALGICFTYRQTHCVVSA
jgi:hypothetical protein